VSFSRSTPVAKRALRRRGALDHLAYMHGEALPGSTAPVAGAS